MFYKIRADVVQAYTEENKYIERKDRKKPETVEFDIYSKDKTHAIGLAACKLGAGGYSHEKIEIV